MAKIDIENIAWAVGMLVSELLLRHIVPTINLLFFLVLDIVFNIKQPKEIAILI